MRRTGAWISWGALIAAALWLGATPAAATPANLDPIFGFVASDLAGLTPERTIYRDYPFLDVGDVSSTAGPFPVNVAGSNPDLLEVCILVGSDPACRANADGVTTPYSVIMSIEVASVAAGLEDPFLLVLTGLAADETIYGPGDLFVELNPTAPVGLDTSAVPNFRFDGAFDPFLHVIDLDRVGADPRYDYIGWEIPNDGSPFETLSFRYEVTNPVDGRIPFIGANAVVVPEPGTALMMGLGLAGLASIRRRPLGAID